MEERELLHTQFVLAVRIPIIVQDRKFVDDMILRKKRKRKVNQS